MNISAERKLIWTLELTDNEMAVLHNYLHGQKITDSEDEDVLDDIKNLVGTAKPPPRN